jgi:hypothetical protein
MLMNLSATGSMMARGLDAEEQFIEHQVTTILKVGEAGRAIKDVFANTRSATNYHQ